MSKIILLTAILFCGLGIYAYGRTIGTKHSCKQPLLTLGFHTGPNLLFSPNKYIDRKNAHRYLLTQGIFVKKEFGQHFAVESSINLTPATSPFSNALPLDKKYTVTIPVVIQYYLLPRTYKLRPYIGTGIIYTPNATNYLINQNQADMLKPHIGCNGSFVTVSVVQGFTYSINTKIEFNESLHFEPSKNNTLSTLGLSLGIGYKL